MHTNSLAITRLSFRFDFDWRQKSLHFVHWGLTDHHDALRARHGDLHCEATSYSQSLVNSVS